MRICHLHILRLGQVGELNLYQYESDPTDDDKVIGTLEAGTVLTAKRHLKDKFGFTHFTMHRQQQKLDLAKIAL